MSVCEEHTPTYLIPLNNSYKIDLKVNMSVICITLQSCKMQPFGSNPIFLFSSPDTAPPNHKGQKKMSTTLDQIKDVFECLSFRVCYLWNVCRFFLCLYNSPGPEKVIQTRDQDQNVLCDADPDLPQLKFTKEQKASLSSSLFAVN